ncbi:MAG: DUF2837 family protein [Anaerolineales bacterium]|nr:DUF2837 family protein [Anaerolineales bacterium]
MQLVIIFLLTTIIHAVDTGSFAARLAGVRTGRLALAGSLYNVLALSSRSANMIAGPFIAAMTDLASGNNNIHALLPNYRILLMAATTGTLIAGMLIPTLSRLIASGVILYERQRSLPRILIRSASIRGVWRMRKSITTPRISAVKKSRWSPFPKRFLLLSILVTSFFSVSNFAALYASAMIPAGARTAASLAPLLTGLAVFINVFVISPYAALVVDEAIRAERPLPDVTYITVWQIGARFVGTLLAQVLLVPMAQIIAYLTQWLVY